MHSLAKEIKRSGDLSRLLPSSFGYRPATPRSLELPIRGDML